MPWPAYVIPALTWWHMSLATFLEIVHSSAEYAGRIGVRQYYSPLFQFRVPWGGVEQGQGASITIQRGRER
jgi:hypothetical protein